MELEKIFKEAKDFLPLLGTDYVEFYVGNAKQAAHFYKSAFGFQSYAYKGLETNSTDCVSYVLIQDKIKIVLTSPLSSSSSINDHIVKHGDGIKIIALWVEDAEKSWKETTSRGAKSYMEGIYLGSLYSKWRNIKGLDKDDPKENIGQMQSSFKEFEKKIK